MAEPKTKMPLTSEDVVSTRADQLKELFPEIVVEGKIDFERLKQHLGEEIDNRPERYGLSWAGKSKAVRALQIPSYGTLIPMRDDAVNFDESENIVIEGDNLEVLKLMQKSYHGKIKMIYIDPPYNTGSDFIYPDDYKEGLETYLKYTRQTDKEGYKISTNAETGGRFHSKWLNMIYPRLFLCKNLLTQDGAIFVSINDKEVNNLRHVMNEICGEENFVAQFVWAAGRKNDSKLVSNSHEYILCYARNKSVLDENKVLWRQRKKNIDLIYKKYKVLKKEHGDDYRAIESDLKQWFKDLPDSEPAKRHSHYSAVDFRGVYFPADISWPGGGGPKYEVLHPVTKKSCKVPARGWMFAEPSKMQEAVEDQRVHFGDDETKVPCIKAYLENSEEEVPYSVFYQDGRASTKRLRALMGGDVFDHPKDEFVLKELIEAVTYNDKDCLTLDCFAGSGAFAHAVVMQNKDDGGNRKFILVQLPEALDPDNKDHKQAIELGYKDIADITRDRVKKVFDKLDVKDGYKAFKLFTSNFKLWQPSSDEKSLKEQLELYAENLLPDRKQEEILYELILKSGRPLTEAIEEKSMAGQTVFSIGNGEALICLEDNIKEKTLDAMIEAQPEQIICLDTAFHGNDQLKANAKLQMESNGKQFSTV